MDELASEKQINYMNRLGIEIPPQCTKRQALKLIKSKLEGDKPKDVTHKYSQEGSKSSTPYPLDKDTLIVRQSCLKAAVEYIDCFHKDAKIEFVLEVAEKFENWVNRPDGK